MKLMKLKAVAVAAEKCRVRHERWTGRLEKELGVIELVGRTKIERYLYYLIKVSCIASLKCVGGCF